MKRLFLIVSALIFLFTVSSAQAAPLQKVTLAHFGQAKFLLYLPLYVAMENGHFKKQGLDVSLKFAGNDNNSFSALISKEADFAIGDPVFAQIAREKGGQGKVVAMMITSLALGGVAKDPKVPVITKPKQLDGLRVSSFGAPSTTYTLLSELKRKHRLTKMTIVQAMFGAQLATLENGRADIATDIEPNVSLAESKGYRRVLSLGQFTDRMAVTGITTLDRTIETKPALVQKFVTALQAAVTEMYKNPGVSYQVALKLYPDMDPKVVRHAVDAMLLEKIYPASVQVDDKLWQRSLKTRLDSGELKHKHKTEEAVDNRFADKAARKR